MKCPACFNPLTEIQIGTLRVDVCQNGCGGIWFDAFELERADDEDAAVGEPLMHIQRDERIGVDFSRKRDCPRCSGIKLHKHFFSAKRRVQVDQCPNCGGYWLDHGELAQIRAEHAQAAQAHEVDRPILSGQVLRYLYRLHTESRKKV
jgi:Zn-finger nucleic acid-binding protein